ncbi:MAG: dTDP-4-dehydrorhamnose 3,5-epimerase family protein [Patescibacteria group bacterium]
MEIFRYYDGLLRRFGQSTMTVANEGTIKAFHWHQKQDDVWFFASGKARVVLYDSRSDSRTRGMTQVIQAGADDYKVILIPAGVVHGYQVLSRDPVILFYHTTEHYDPGNPDEFRMAHNDPKINFDWNG